MHQNATVDAVTTKEIKISDNKYLITNESSETKKEKK